MKKSINFILVIIFCVALVGCISNNLTTSEDGFYDCVNNSNNLIAENKDYIFYIDYMSIKKLDKSDNTLHTVFESDSIIENVEYFNERLYFSTNNQKSLSSITLKGEDLITSNLSNELLEHTINSYYTFSDNLYLTTEFLKTIYLINPDTLEIQPADTEILNQIILPSKDTILSFVDSSGIKRIYQKNTEQELALLSGESDGKASLIDVTNQYVFYGLYAKDFSWFELHRINLATNDNVLLKKIDPRNAAFDIRADDKYLYFTTNSDELLKIDKATLEEENIADIIERPSHEIANEKFFYIMGGNPYYVDLKTKETVSLL